MYFKTLQFSGFKLLFLKLFASFPLLDPERWTNIPLLVKILKLIINELSNAMEANASRQTAADWSQGIYAGGVSFLILIDSE